jgi:NTE family protein
VAVDLMAPREVWFSRGPLFDAIRASIAIPTVFRPHHYQGRILVDGGLLNPVPITPTLRDLTDCTIAVDVNAPAEMLDGNGAPVDAAPDAVFGSASGSEVPPAVEASQTPEIAAVPPTPLGYRQKIAEFLDRMTEKREKKQEQESDPGTLELFARSLDVVQETITRFKLAAQPPDLLIPIPRNACAFYEFHRAEELIELGRARAREVLRHYRPVRKR